jgi:hypothetical protein
MDHNEAIPKSEPPMGKRGRPRGMTGRHLNLRLRFRSCLVSIMAVRLTRPFRTSPRRPRSAPWPVHPRK